MPDTAEHRAKVSLTPVLAVAFPVLWGDAPRKEGSPLASQSCVDFKVLFSRLLEDQKGICPPSFCPVVRHSICVYPPGSFPRVELTDDLLIVGQGSEAISGWQGSGMKAGGSRWHRPPGSGVLYFPPCRGGWVAFVRSCSQVRAGWGQSILSSTNSLIPSINGH